jgi:uncharacterized protein (TIGR00661 family)
MARILFGVHGTGRGHAIRALTIARHYPAHEFLFVSHGEAARLLRSQFRVLECPNPVTPVSAHRVRALSALLSTAGMSAATLRWTREVRRAAEDFKPDVAITDYEFFVPRVAHAMRLPCLSVDNQHAITLGRIAFPVRQTPSWLATYLAIRLLFSSSDQYLISCFFEVPLRTPSGSVRWMPPMLRAEVLGLRPEAGEHVVAYQGYPSFARFTEVLGALGRPVHVYGMGGGPNQGRLSFRDFREQAFLEDLATCAYVVCGGGHTLISEALHLGKPVLSIPVRGAFEQFLNAFNVECCGYGQLASTASFSIGGLRDFEKRLDSYRHRIRERSFCGNDAVFAALDDFISGRWRPSTRQVAASAT